MFLFNFGHTVYTILIFLAEKGYQIKAPFQLHAINVAINQDPAASPHFFRQKSVSKFHSERGRHS